MTSTSGWNHYIRGGLRDYLVTGHSSPYMSPGDQARREAESGE